MESYSIFRDLAIIIVFAKVFGIIARKCKAPQVVGEIIAGLLIGPSVLGLVQQSDFLIQMAEIGVILLMFSAAAFADSTEMTTEDQMVGLVKSFLEENEFPYEYDDYTFTVPFAVENSMEYVYMTVYIYDDMLAVSADAPVQGTGDVFEKMAEFAALVNNEIYYAQFRVELDADKVYVSCRSCNLVEDVIPGENELFYLFAMPQSYMEDYGDGILAVLDGGDPYEAFEACQAAVDAQ